MSGGWIGLFDLFRIGVGPSSSHTVGPMLAAAHFAGSLDMQADAIRVELFGSLALTGKGHGTDTAVILGLGGARPETLDPDDAAVVAAEVRRTRRLTLPSGRRIGWSSVVQDVTERQREADEILYLSRHDPLTGLYNRRYFQERLEEERQRWNRSGKPFSLIMADIDRFKNFNDDYGHDCGDLVLRSLSEVMLSSLRETDSVGRWGGEEFIVLLPETGPEGSHELAEKLRLMVESLRVSYGGTELGVTITAGYASYRGGDIDECIRMADSALLRGKNSGRNVVIGE